MPGTGNTGKAAVALACQGGGSHAAYTAGVLKTILRQQKGQHFQVMGFSGTSGGAICALLAWYGQLQAGPNTAKGAERSGELLEAFWYDNAASSLWERVVNWWAVELQRLPVEIRLSPYEMPFALTKTLLESWSPRREFVDLKALLAAHISFPAIEAIGRFQAFEADLRAQRKHQGLRELTALIDGQPAFDESVEVIQERVARANSDVQRLADFDQVKEILDHTTSQILTRTHVNSIEADIAEARRRLPILLVGAVNVLSGKFKTFSSLLGEISVNSMAASATLPWIFQAQQVNGSFYWDGLFSHNPPILKFVSGQEEARDKPDEIWVVQINPQTIATLPTTADGIQERRARLTGNLSLYQEIEAIEAVNKWIADGSFSADDQHKMVAIHHVEMDSDRLETYRSSDTASKVERDPSFLRALMQHGEAQAALFWPVRCFVEEVINARAPMSSKKALEGSVAADVVLRFPPRWPEVRGRDALGKVIAQARDAFSSKGHPPLHVAVTRMEPHHPRSAATDMLATPEPEDGMVWEIDWEARGAFAATAGQPDTLVYLEGSALATVRRNRLSAITLQTRDAVRAEHTVEHPVAHARPRTSRR